MFPVLRRRSAPAVMESNDVFRSQVRAVCTYLDVPFDDDMASAVDKRDASRCAAMLKEHAGSADADVERLIKSIAEANVQTIQHEIYAALRSSRV